MPKKKKQLKKLSKKPNKKEILPKKHKAIQKKKKVISISKVTSTAEKVKKPEKLVRATKKSVKSDKSLGKRVKENQNKENLRKIAIEVDLDIEDKLKKLVAENKNLQHDLDRADEEISDYIEAKNKYYEMSNVWEKMSKQNESILQLRTKQVEDLSVDYENLRNRYIDLTNQLETQVIKISSPPLKKKGKKMIQNDEVGVKKMNKLEKSLESANNEIDDLIENINLLEIKNEETETEKDKEIEYRQEIENKYNNLKKRINELTRDF